MIKKGFNFLKKHPLLILLWVSVASISGLMTWIILLSPETKALRTPPSCKIPMPQIPLEFIEPVDPKKFGNNSKTEHVQEPDKKDLCWQKNAIAFNGSKDIPHFAIILAGLGLSQELTIRAIKELPPYITLNFSPYTYNLDDWIQKAKEANHEVLIDLPITQHEGIVCDGGMLALDSRLTLEDNSKKMEELIGKASQAIGFSVSDIDDSFPHAFWAPLKKQMDDKGLLLVSSTQSKEILKQPNIIKPTPIHSDIGEEEILKQLLVIEQKCPESKKEIVIATINPAMIDLIQKWSVQLSDKPFVLAPLTAIVSAHE
ncbi:MAG: divergent polysaccharide deacetylase family protein [Alphaproteobacteria bacterium]|nr:divergent polysaccharide deacetylase family protein [Alphaproteobacteria bacterium]